MAEVRRRMRQTSRQSAALISVGLDIQIVTLCQWRKTWRLQGEVVPGSDKDLDVWSNAEKLTVILETAGLNTTELSA